MGLPSIFFEQTKMIYIIKRASPRTRCAKGGATKSIYSRMCLVNEEVNKNKKTSGDPYIREGFSTNHNNCN